MIAFALNIRADKTSHKSSSIENVTPLYLINKEEKNVLKVNKQRLELQGVYLLLKCKPFSSSNTKGKSL